MPDFQQLHSKWEGYVEKHKQPPKVTKYVDCPDTGKGKQARGGKEAFGVQPGLTRLLLRPQEFVLQTEAVPSNKMKVIEDIVTDEQHGRETRWPYKATRGKPEIAMTPIFAAPVCCLSFPLLLFAHTAKKIGEGE